MQRVPYFCGKDCGGNACPLLAIVEDGRVTGVVNNPLGGKNLSGCQRGFNSTQILYAPDRIIYPLIRDGERGNGHFRRASWDEALDLTAQKLTEIQTRFGAESILNMSSGGDTGALHCTDTLLDRFLGLLGGYTDLANNYSNGAARFVLPYLLGEQWLESGHDAATMQYSELIILWGANVLETRMGTEVGWRLLEAKKRGVPIVVIDPRRTPTVEKTASWWIKIRPGTDVAMMLAVLHVLISENLVDQAFIQSHSFGFEKLAAYVLGRDGVEAHSPQWAEPICGVPADDIIRFARLYGAAKPAMLLPGYSIQRSYAGEESFRMTVALQVATANLGVRGGSSGSLNNRISPPKLEGLQNEGSPAHPQVPIVRWPDAILEGKKGGYPTDIHAAYVLGANFLNQGSDIQKNIAAFKKLDFAVCHDVFLTPSARYCDVVFPVATAFEKEDIGIPWLGNYLLYRPQIVKPMGEVRCDYDILCALAERLGFGEAYSEGRDTAAWIDFMISRSEIPDGQAFRESGIYLAPDQERVGLADFRRDPEAYPLSTPSGKVEIASERYHLKTGFPDIPTWQQPPVDERYPLRLITPKMVLFIHSQGSNIPERREKTAHALLINPQDANGRGILDGQTVNVYNQQGSSLVRARVSEDIMPGTVCLPEGMWVELDEGGVDHGGSANMLTSTQGTEAGTNCIMHGVGVEVVANA